ncbi:MAG: MBL fold metallo-hydrolase [Phycisphaeraceae bacterium]
MPLELLFLGTGTSAGVPMIGCDCAVCRSDDPRDHRSRPSVLIRYPEPGAAADQPPRQLLIDTAPELRSQVIRHHINRLDGVLFTHTHADHIFGLDDIRRYNAVMQAPMDLYAEPETLERIRSMFWYIFEPQRNVNQSFVPNLVTQTIHPNQPFNLFGVTWTPLRLLHGKLPILGYRVDLPGPNGGSLAYCTDVSSIPPETYPRLAGLDVLVIDALRYRHHPTHLTVDQALEQIEQIKPRRAYLTHIAHDIMHADLEPRLPEHVFLAFDGLVVGCVRPHR